MFAMHPEGNVLSKARFLPTDPILGTVARRCGVQLKNNWNMRNNPTHPGWSHVRASLPEKIEIARSSYRLYVHPNVYVFERGKLRHLETVLVAEAFALHDRESLVAICKLHAALQVQFDPTGPQLDGLALLMRFDLGLGTGLD